MRKSIDGMIDKALKACMVLAVTAQSLCSSYQALSNEIDDMVLRFSAQDVPVISDYGAQGERESAGVPAGGQGIAYPRIRPALRVI